MKRLKIGIRPQLIFLVGFACLVSLLILGLVTGIYFSDNLKSLRSERLSVISQLKIVQVQQAMAFLDITVDSLSQVDTIISPLKSDLNGNTSSLLYKDVESLFQQYLSTDIFLSARLYNRQLEIVMSTKNEPIILSQGLKDRLYPIPSGGPLPFVVQEYTSDSFYYTGPYPNNTDSYNSSYFAGTTAAIYDQNDPSSNRTLIGYISVISSANSIYQALNTTTTDYWTLAIRPFYEGNAIDHLKNETSNITAFQTVFFNNRGVIRPGVVYQINRNSFVKKAFNSKASNGVSTNVRSVNGDKLAVGYRKATFSNWNWLIVTVQKKSTFNAPVTKLKKIIIGVVIGVGAFMCMLTFSLAFWFIRPITRLKEATISITRFKKGRTMESGTSPSPSNDTPTMEKFDKRNSVHSISTGSGSVYSTGFRVPPRIPPSKMLFKDELTELTEAFNIMTEELEKQYTHLEDRVRLRTKELEASKIEAESANEAKTVFIANISHELRTPLNGILGMASIAIEENDRDRMKDSLKLIYRSGELLLQILTELLTYSKNTLNRSKLEKSNFQILEITYQIQSIFSKLAQDQRVNFKISVRPNIFRKLILYGDSNRIIQIIMNLVSNALKFTPVDGFVDVSFRLLGDYDSVRSEKSKFEQVYAMPSTNNNKVITKTEPLSPVLESDRRTDYFAPNITPTSKQQENIDDLTNNKKNNKDSDNKNKNNNSNNNNNNNNDYDSQSMTTISSAQYEKKIQESQFKKPNSNTLSACYRTLSEGVSLKVSRTSSVTTINNDQSSVNRLTLTPSTSEYKGYPNLDKKLDLNSSLANNEIIKNDKVFKVRNMYEPKTWVIQVEVKDTGSGIEPSLQEKVFEPFIQGDQTLSRSYGGTGLGLSICRQLAKMMNGTLVLKSELGQGSTFTLTLPLPQTGEIVVPPQDFEEFCNDEFNPNSKVNRKVAFDDNAVVVLGETNTETDKIKVKNMVNSGDDNKKTIPTSGASLFSSDSNGSVNKSFKKSSFIDKPELLHQTSTGTADPGLIANQNTTVSSDENSFCLTSARILVAEDNKVNQEVIKRMLRLEGFTDTTMACNGAEAIELLKKAQSEEQPFDMIFMDVQMPQIDGLLATKIIRQDLQYTRPIIALTAFADESNVKECYNSGMNGFLAKPIKRNGLKKVFQEFGPILLDEILKHKKEETITDKGKDVEWIQ
ncbi:SLN1 [Candida oxycetoniae]|uniref:histidine kinase n=1 Tax=Candida oxycetoniae TaxID=497107 RepID=A0AAI9WXI8_9ASCO|nr:SLN1 [Candida oxycetoniae]KAI3404287.2 SLN1 [Candida oxycetoniae]